MQMQPITTIHDNILFKRPKNPVFESNHAKY